MTHIHSLLAFITILSFNSCQSDSLSVVVTGTIVDRYLKEMRKAMVPSDKYEGALGFPYASNPGTGYGSDPYWEGADRDIVISSGASYIFAKRGFNPFGTENDKPVPSESKFWAE